MGLPEGFLIKMKGLLKEEYEHFIKSFEEKKTQGLRINSLKINIDEFTNISPFTLDKIPWVNEGFYYSTEERPGKHPYHEAGLYYIQEPSAMAVGEIMDVKPGEKVLDLCAAPGGKTTHMAVKMKGHGLLVANEVNPKRARILSENVERMGITNVVVTNETPFRLAQRFLNYFDKVLVDAPCSGEGMFRKNPDTCMQWSEENVKKCVQKQMDILQNASAMLKPGGRLVYSTCTFSPEENEGVISKFLKHNPYFEIENINTFEGFDKGKIEWAEEKIDSIHKTIRIWPHKLQGEGHYIAVMKKLDGEEYKKFKYVKPLKDKKILKDYYRFAKEYLLDIPKGNYILFGEQLYIIPEDILSLEKLKILRPGWHLGTFKKNRFKPSHALAMSLNRNKVKYKWNLEGQSQEIISYLKGEVLKAEGKNGWYLIEVDGYSIGWGKLVNNLMKNHYPKGLRWRGNSDFLRIG